MKTPFQNNKIITVGIILLFCILPLPILYKWFGGGTIIYFWDTNFPLDQILGLQHYFYLWKTNVFPGFLDTGWSWLPYIIILSVFNFFTHSNSVNQAFLYWVLLVSSLGTFYILLRYLFQLLHLKEDIFLQYIKIIGAIIYTFNTYVYYYSFRIFNPQEFITAFLPIHFLSLLQLFPVENLEEKKTMKFSIRWLFVFFVSLFLMTSGFSTLIYYIEYLGILGFYLLYQFLVNQKYTLREVLKRVIFFVMIIVFNMWWFYPMYIGLHDVYTKAAAIGTTIYFTLASQLSNLLNATRIIGLPPMQTPLFSWEHYYVDNQFFTFALFVFPFSIILLMLKLSKIPAKKLVIFLLTIFLLMLFVVKEANPPFSFILQFAFEHIPFFGVFRDAYQKAGLFYVFVYVILFALALAIGYSTIVLKKYSKGIILLILTLPAVIVITAPFFIFENIPFITVISGQHQITYSAKTKIPTEYDLLKQQIEPLCKDKTVIVIPRTSILSSAQWQKTGYSYIAQDVLSDYINCNFVSTQILVNESDTYFSIPYLSLQQNDIQTFKNFLYQSNISVVLIRHDYMSNPSTDFVNLDANTVNAVLKKDKDFKQTYHNNLFDIYTFNLQKKDTYGLSFAKNSIYTNADFTDGLQTEKVIQSLDTQNKSFITDTQSQFIPNKAIIFANCIGCEYLPGSIFNIPVQTSTIQTGGLLQKIKNIIRPRLTVGNPLDMSLNLMDQTFELWKTTNTKQEKDAYTNDINQTINQYEHVRGNDFFENDYAAIKVRNYIQEEQKSLLDLIQSNKPVNIPDKKLIYAFQTEKLNQLNQAIWETDYTNDIYRYRVDLPSTSQYVCHAQSNNNLITVNDVLLDSHSVVDSSDAFEKGSHKLEIRYTPHNLFKQDSISLSGKGIVVQKIPLHNFTARSYYGLSAQIASSAADSIQIIIATNDMSAEEIYKKEADKNSQFIYKGIDLQTVAAGKTDYFYSSNNYLDNYYLYVIADLGKKQNSLTINNLTIEPIPTKDTLLASCTGGTSKSLLPLNSTVTKISPTEYELSTKTNGTVKAVLTFNQAYHPFWVAYTYINGKKHVYQHVTQSGYANAWYIDTVGNKRIYIEFIAQNQAEKVAVISLLIFIILMISYLKLH